jgi:hypothetical protein
MRSKVNMMKKIGLLALLVAMAGPAWAANPYEGFSDTAVALRSAAYAVCREVGTAGPICSMKTAPSEAHALDGAKHALAWCAADGVPAGYHATAKDCPEIRAYIKQRWGY